MSSARLRNALATVVLGGLLLAGCGNESTLEKADEALGKLQRGEFKLALRASAGAGDTATRPVGFDIGGHFDIGAKTAFPILDLTYQRLLGEQQLLTTVKSDGTRIVVTTDGKAAVVPPEQAERLRLADGDRPAGVGDLGLSGWITKPVETSGPVVDGVATRRISGPVNAADLISDLAALASELSGQTETSRLDDEAADRLQAKVRAGEVELLVDEDNLPRRARATVDFDASGSPDLQKALGPYAAAHLEINLEIHAPGQAVVPPELP